MKQGKQFLRPLLMAIVMLVGMLVPQGAWAQELFVRSGEKVTISSDASYELITVVYGATLIINEGVSVSATANGYITADGTVINYGTINGILVQDRCIFANHGNVTGSIFVWDGGTIYNTGTYVNKPWNNIDNQITPCEHAVCTEAEVAATCTHAGGMQTKCDVCHYIKSFVEDENSPALGHSFNSHKGFNTCTRCGLATYDAPELKSGYYQIANAGNLYWFADKVNNDYANFKYANAKLTADIVVNEGTIDEDSNAIAWPGIGNLLRDTNDPEEGPQEGPHEEGDDRIKGYEGIFDGQGHTISGLYSSNGAAGLVEVSAGNCIIKNVGIVNSYFHNGTIGVICKVCADNTEISNCYSNAICKGDYIGGIVGILLSNQASIKNCYSTSTLSSWNSYDDRTGGIVGEISIDDGSIPSGEDESTALGANISNCYTTYKQICSNATGTNCEASVSADRFASGEIAWLLNDGKTNGTQAWYQKLGENGDSYPVLAAAEGNTVYYGYVNCQSESETYSNDLRYAEKEDAHDYQVQKDENEKPVFVWSEDYTTATLQLVCSRVAEHTAGVEVTGEDITSEDTTPATCTTAGVRTYTAKATYEGVEYTGTKEVEIPATGHSFNNKTLTASPVENGLYAYVCDNGCGGHGDYNVVKASVESEGEDATSIELTDDGEGNFSAASVKVADGKAFETPVEFTVPSDQVTVERTFTAEKPASVMLPFTVPVGQISGATFWTFGGVSFNVTTQKWEATMTQVETGNLEAYKPYMVVPAAASITFNNGTSPQAVTFVKTSEASGNMSQTGTLGTATEGWTFKAVNAPKAWAEGDPDLGKAYGFAAAGHELEGFTEGQFVKVDAGASAAPGRCYLMKDNSDPLTRAVEELPTTIGIRFVVSGTTGIGTLDTETGAFTFDGWYDLQGNRVSEPKQGSVMIKNNKKVMVK